MSKYLGKHVESEKCIYQQGTLRKVCMWLYCVISNDFQTCFTSCSYQQQPWNLVPLRWPSQNVVPSFSVNLLPAVHCWCHHLLSCVTSSTAIYGSGGLINISDFILYKSANSSSVVWVILCIVWMCDLCVGFVCVILCMCLHSRKLVYSGEVSELVKVPTVLSSFLNQKQLFHKAVYFMSLTAHCWQW